MCLNLKPNNGLKIYEVDLGNEIELWAHLKTERRPQPAQRFKMHSQGV